MRIRRFRPLFIQDARWRPRPAFWKIAYSAVVSEKALPVRYSAMTIRSGRACALATRRVSWLPVSWKTSTVPVIPNADLLVRIERVTEFNQSLSKTNPVTPAQGVSFLLLKPGMDLKGRTDEIQSFFKERYWILPV